MHRGLTREIYLGAVRTSCTPGIVEAIGAGPARECLRSRQTGRLKAGDDFDRSNLYPGRAEPLSWMS